MAGKAGLASFTATVKETDLHIQADSDLSRTAVKAALKSRDYIESCIKQHPWFLTSLAPLTLPFPAPDIVEAMIQASQKANVGPMAAVAGAVADYVGRSLLKHSQEVIVENGGDIFMKLDTDAIFSIYAGKSPLSMTTGVKIKQTKGPVALCTSSGTLGHSKSFGRADAATVISNSCPLADAVATALGNIVKKETDIQVALDKGKTIPGVKGIIIIKGNSMGVWGDLELVRLT